MALLFPFTKIAVLAKRLEIGQSSFPAERHRLDVVIVKSDCQVGGGATAASDTPEAITAEHLEPGNPPAFPT